MRGRIVGDLIAHPWLEEKAATVHELRLQLAVEAEQHMPLRAPVIGTIVLGVLHEAHANGAELTRAPDGHARLAWVFSRLDGGPVGDSERDVGEDHGVGWNRVARGGRRTGAVAT
jgi:hypothetical protein